MKNPALRRVIVALIVLAFLVLAAVPPGRAADGEDMPEVLDVDAAAALMRVQPSVVRSLAEAQAIPARRVGDDWRFARDALLEWLKGERFAGMAIVPPGRSAGAEVAQAVPASKREPGANGSSGANATPDAIGERPTAPTAAEVALRNQRVLLAGGAASLDLGVAYARSEQSLYPIMRVEQNSASASASLRYGIRDDLQLTARLPGAYRRTVAYVDGSVAGAVAPINRHDSYLGDASVSLLGVAAHEASKRPNVIWSVDSVLPTGPGDSGIGGGLVFSKGYDPAVLFAGFNYLYGISTDPTSPRRQLAKHNFGINLGYTYALNDTLALNSSLIGTYRNTHSADGVAPPPSRERYLLQFGMTWMLSPRLFVEPAVGFGLGGSSPDLLLSLNLPYSL